jgi:membrane-bound metal-dependent hydrolase YbcI (DUF457 family)
VPRSVRARVPWRWLALGCLLPDLIDKPIWVVAQRLGSESEHFDMARLVGHTAFLAAAIALVAWRTRSPAWVALAYGIPTHLVLDVITDYVMGGGWGVWKGWLFWPFQVPRLRELVMVGSALGELAGDLKYRVYIAGEVVGALLLLWDYARNRFGRDRR